MSDGQESHELDVTSSDYVASAAKAVVGAAPFVGSLLVELAGYVIPNQRIDRIAKFAVALEARLDAIEREFVESQLHDEDFDDLLEEALLQAARSTSDARREHIANLVANSLANEDITYIESKRLLRFAGELDDVELIWLGFYAQWSVRDRREYHETHRAVLEPRRAHLGSPEAEVDKQTLQQSCKIRLAALGLLEDDKVSRLGRLLARELGLVGPLASG